MQISSCLVPNYLLIPERKKEFDLNNAYRYDNGGNRTRVACAAETTLSFTPLPMLVLLAALKVWVFNSHLQSLTKLLVALIALSGYQNLCRRKKSSQAWIWTHVQHCTLMDGRRMVYNLPMIRKYAYKFANTKNQLNDALRKLNFCHLQSGPQQFSCHRHLLKK